MITSEIYEIPVADIVVSDENVRHSDREKDLDELADSIKKHGLLQPVVLLGGKGNIPPYKLISGQRRLLAHEKLGKKTIRAVFAGKLDRTQALIRSLVENLQRLDLDYNDTADVITELYEKFNKNDRKVALETGLSLRKVRDYIRIEALASPDIKAKLKRGVVRPVDVKRALRASRGNVKKAEEILDYIIEYKPTSYQKKRIADEGESRSTASARTIVEAAMAPRLEATIVVALPNHIKQALENASKAMELDPEDLAIRALQEWLYQKGFIG
jgi:ParB family chromosome partitioning protein